MRRTLGLALWACALLAPEEARAQYDDTDEPGDWEIEEIRDEKPPRRERANTVYVMYAPSQYLVPGAPHLHVQELAAGYARSIAVSEDAPFFVEAGAELRYGHAKAAPSRGGAECDLLTARVPVSLTYKFYLGRTGSAALAPFAGVYGRVTASARAKGADGGSAFPRYAEDGATHRWDRAQLGWQAGVRYLTGRVSLGVSYSRDFPDDSKHPSVHASAVSLGVRF